MNLMNMEKFWEFFWKEMLYPKFKTMMKSYFHLYLTFLSRQLDNDDANDDENELFFPGQTNIEHMKYHKENNLYTMSRSELQITISHRLSATILLLFISAAIGYFAQESYLERWQQFSKIQKTYQFSFPIWEEHVKEAEKWCFKSKIWKPKISSFVITKPQLLWDYFNKVKFTRNFGSCSKNWIKEEDGRFVAMVTKDLQTVKLKSDQVMFNSLVLTRERNFDVTFGIFSVLVFQISVLESYLDIFLF